MADATCRVRWQDEDGTEHVITAVADDAAGIVTVTLEGGQVVTVDATHGRALQAVLTHLVYPYLAPRRTELITEYWSRKRWREVGRLP
jgi:DNA-binding transcriptional regulator LsrR (DeoR family)